MCSRGRDNRFRIMLPRLDRLSLRRTPKPTNAPKRKSAMEAAMGGSLMQPQRRRPDNGGSSSNVAGASSSAPAPDLDGLSLEELQLRIGMLWSRMNAAKDAGAPPNEIDAMDAELRRLRLAEHRLATAPPPPPPVESQEEQQLSEGRALEMIARFFGSGSAPDEWTCRWCGWKGRPNVQPDEDGVDAEYCPQCDRPGASYASEDQLPNVGGEDLGGAAAAQRNEIDEQEEVTRRQNALIELKHVFPEWTKSQLAHPLPEDVRLLRLANLRVSQAMIWLRLLSDSNEDAQKLLGIALTANELALARDLARHAVIQMVRNGGWPDKNDSTRLRGSPLFWAIALAREVVARRSTDPFAFYEPNDPAGRRTRAHDYSMQGIADFLERYLKQAMLADESQIAATRVGRKQKFAQQKLEQRKYRRPQWYGLGSTELRKQHKLDYLNDLLAASRMGALQPSTMDYTSLPTVLQPFVRERARRRRQQEEAAAAAAAAAAAEATATEDDEAFGEEPDEEDVPEVPCNPQEACGEEAFGEEADEEDMPEVPCDPQEECGEAEASGSGDNTIYDGLVLEEAINKELDRMGDGGDDDDSEEEEWEDAQMEEGEEEGEEEEGEEEGEEEDEEEGEEYASDEEEGECVYEYEYC